jgi:hypothetical protein
LVFHPRGLAVVPEWSLLIGGKYAEMRVQGLVEELGTPIEGIEESPAWLLTSQQVDTSDGRTQF